MRACTRTSSAVVGSSAMSKEGLRASAPAMTTRWRIPPESWCGRSCITESIRGISTSSRSSRTRARGETSSPVSLRAARTSAMSCVPTVSTGLMPASELWGT